MAAITSLIVSTGLAIKGQQDVKRARQEAAAGQAEAAERSAEILEREGRAAEADIARSSAEAARRIASGIEEARAPIQPFTEAAKGFDAAQGLIMDGGPIGGPLAESIGGAAMAGGAGQAFAGLGSPIEQEKLRQSQLAVSGATPALTGALLTQGQQGISALGDIARIGQRGLETQADIATGGAAGRASALIGQAPQLQQLQTAQQEARLLGGIAGQQAQAQTAEQLARLAGRVV